MIDTGPDPDCILKWRSGVRDAYRRLAELDAKRIREGLTRDEDAEEAECRRVVARTLLMFVEERVYG